MPPTPNPVGLYLIDATPEKEAGMRQVASHHRLPVEEAHIYRERDTENWPALDRLLVAIRGGSLDLALYWGPDFAPPGFGKQRGKIKRACNGSTHIPAILCIDAARVLANIARIERNNRRRPTP